MAENKLLHFFLTIGGGLLVIGHNVPEKLIVPLLIKCVIGIRKITHRLLLHRTTPNWSSIGIVVVAAFVERAGTGDPVAKMIETCQ